MSFPGTLPPEHAIAMTGALIDICNTNPDPDENMAATQRAIDADLSGLITGFLAFYVQAVTMLAEGLRVRPGVIHSQIANRLLDEARAQEEQRAERP